MQAASFLRRTVLAPAACLALTYFSALSHKRHYFRKKNNWVQNLHFDFFYNFYLKYFSLLEEFRAG
jgi:hypothetical protein